VPVDDRGFLYGDGAFETIRIHHGAPFRLAQHMARLEESLRIIGLTPPLPAREILRGARSLVETARMDEGLLRITVTASDAGSDRPGHVVVSLRPLPKVEGPVTLILFTSHRRLPGPLSRAKTLSRSLEAWALRVAKQAGAFDAVLLNPSGRLVETTARNLFLVRDGRIRTPPIADGALPGITREAVLHLAAEAGVRAAEETLDPEDLRAASEVFLTGSGIGVLGVAAVEDARYHPVPGPVTADLAARYAALVDRESTW